MKTVDQWELNPTLSFVNTEETKLSLGTVTINSFYSKLSKFQQSQKNCPIICPKKCM